METLINPGTLVNPETKNFEEKFSNIPGWGMDADRENDPAYPMKQRIPGVDHEGMNYEKAPQQIQEIELLRTIERPNITRVFGTSTPPKGLSGALRRQAFKYSEATAAHWMTLILADRIDVVQGIMQDLSHGTIPNFFAELGWKAEWEHNRTKFVTRLAVKAVAITAVVALLRMKKKNKTRNIFRHT
ncbi:MAG TPA: hypothetical protein VM101_12700 [Flavitalea sp.]|nr:hypothetical protein [Flavitalea sp.]